MKILETCLETNSNRLKGCIMKKKVEPQKKGFQLLLQETKTNKSVQKDPKNPFRNPIASPCKGVMCRCVAQAQLLGHAMCLAALMFETSVFDSGSCTRNHFYTPTRVHPPLKTDEKCRQKAELGFAECNFQNSDKKYLANGVCTKRLFLPSKKPKLILCEVWVLLKDYVLLPLPYTHSSALPAAVMKLV